MCGITQNNEQDNHQVNDLHLKDNKRTALVSNLDNLLFRLIDFY